MKIKFALKLTLVFLLMITVLFSLVVGTIIFAKPNNPNKPDKPDKPEEPLPDLVEADFKIWMGNFILNPPEDVVLQSYGDQPIDYLFVEDHNGGHWLPRPTKGKPSLEGWAIWFGRVGSPDEEPEYCGTYDINDQNLFDTLELHETFDFGNQDVHSIIIQHLYLPYDTPIRPNPPEADFWDLRITWDIGTWGVPNPYPPPEEIPRHLHLSGITNPDSVKEGAYNADLDTWTITFDTIFELLENAAEPEGPDTGPTYNKLWEGPLSFTVKIQRIFS